MGKVSTRQYPECNNLTSLSDDFIERNEVIASPVTAACSVPEQDEAMEEDEVEEVEAYTKGVLERHAKEKQQEELLQSCMDVNNSLSKILAHDQAKLWKVNV